jgi:hypothetical protein
MKNVRLTVAVVVVAALVVLSFRTTTSSATAVPAIPCTTSALGQAFDGQFHLASIQNFGCEEDWAFVWATVGTGEQAIGVTEVLNFRVTTQHWAIVSRATDCKASILPDVVYRQGCFSN